MRERGGEREREKERKRRERRRDREGEREKNFLVSGKVKRTTELSVTLCNTRRQQLC